MATVSLPEARARLTALVDDAVTAHEPIEITRNGHRVAVLLGADEYDALIEHLTSCPTSACSPTSAPPCAARPREMCSAPTISWVR